MQTRKIVIGALVVVIGVPVVVVLVAVVSFYVSFYALDRANWTMVSSGQKREYLRSVSRGYDRTDAAVVLYTIRGGGHTWPGGTPMPEWILGPTSRSIDGSSHMWAFLREHRLPSQEQGRATDGRTDHLREAVSQSLTLTRPGCAWSLAASS